MGGRWRAGSPVHALFDKDAGFMYKFAAKRSEVFFQVWWDAVLTGRRTFYLDERCERDEVGGCHSKTGACHKQSRPNKRVALDTGHVESPCQTRIREVREWMARARCRAAPKWPWTRIARTVFSSTGRQGQGQRRARPGTREPLALYTQWPKVASPSTFHEYLYRLSRHVPWERVPRL